MKLWILPISIVLLIISYGFGISNEEKYGLFRVLTFGSGAFFIVLSALILEEKNLYHAGTKFTTLGNASYTLYLSHHIIIQYYYYTGLRSLFTSQGTILPLIGFFFLILLCVIFSLVYYKKVEKPIYQRSIS